METQIDAKTLSVNGSQSGFQYKPNNERQFVHLYKRGVGIEPVAGAEAEAELVAMAVAAFELPPQAATQLSVGARRIKARATTAAIKTLQCANKKYKFSHCCVVVSLFS